MTAAMKPLGDTVRLIEWDELPAQARDIPFGFNPLAAGVLMKHQVDWLKIHAPIKAIPKGRRTGITFCEALDSTILAATRRSAGGDNVYYIGDTKEKGLEFIGYCAKFARVIAQAQGEGVSGIEEFIFKDVDERGNSRDITSYRIRFTSGFQIVALSSRPANIRGLQGKVIIDEAAFHQDVQGVLDAATALLIWGGRIVVISSHNGKGNPFNQLVLDIEAGRYGDEAKVLTVTFDDAVTNGLYERVCLMKGIEPNAEEKKKWYMRIRNAYGPRKAAMREELDAIPRDGQGTCLPAVWVDQAMPEVRTVLRLVLQEDFINKSEEQRREWCDEWIKKHLDPELAKLDMKRLHCAGQDFARHRDFSFIMPFEITQALRRVAPFVIEMHKVPTRQQEQILWHMLDRLPNFSGIAMDATGSGETLAEYTGDRYGTHLVHQIKLTRSWYGTWMPKLVQAFEDAMIDLPRDENLQNDFRAIEDNDGIPMVAKVRRKDVKDPELFRHGDGASAGVLAWFASLHLGSPMEWMAAPTRDEMDSSDDYDGWSAGKSAW